MSEDAIVHRRIPFFVVVLCVAAALFISFLFYLPIIFKPGAFTLEFLVLVLIQLASWLLWAALFPLVHAFVRRLRRSRVKRTGLALLHAAAAVAFVTVHSLLTSAAWIWIFPLFLPDFPPESKQPMVFDFYQFGMQFLVYGFLLAGLLGFDYYRKFKDRELKASRLEARLALARLEVLKTQIHPHFLFNTLNGILALVSTDPEAAELMIGRLSELLRVTLQSEGPGEIPLREEIRILGLYLDIMEARYKDRLAFTIELDEGMEDALVPGFLLQPLVENAVRHGIAPRIKGGAVDVRARREGDRLVLEVADDGPGFPDDPSVLMNRGLGLANTQARLELLYGKEGLMKLENRAGGGARVEIRMPFRTEPGAGSDPRSETS